MESLRKQGGVKPIKLESIAGKVGRKLDPRGKEPTWVNENFTELRPISIPHHSHLVNATKDSILDDLEMDIERWEQELGSVEEED